MKKLGFLLFHAGPDAGNRFRNCLGSRVTTAYFVTYYSNANTAGAG